MANNSDHWPDRIRTMDAPKHQPQVNQEYHRRRELDLHAQEARRQQAEADRREAERRHHGW